MLEYKVIYPKLNDNLESEINKLSNEGWEIVSFVADMTAKYTLIFKREKK
jgi:hypothetical protein